MALAIQLKLSNVELKLCLHSYVGLKLVLNLTKFVAVQLAYVLITLCLVFVISMQ